MLKNVRDHQCSSYQWFRGPHCKLVGRWSALKHPFRVCFFRYILEPTTLGQVPWVTNSGCDLCTVVCSRWKSKRSRITERSWTKRHLQTRPIAGKHWSSDEPSSCPTLSKGIFLYTLIPLHHGWVNGVSMSPGREPSLGWGGILGSNDFQGRFQLRALSQLTSPDTERMNVSSLKWSFDWFTTAST